MRKSINEIHIILDEHGFKNKKQGLYIFSNKDRNKVKIVSWDRNGYVLYYKRLEQRRFKFPRDKAGYLELTETQLSELLRG